MGIQSSKKAFSGMDALGFLLFLFSSALIVLLIQSNITSITSQTTEDPPRVDPLEAHVILATFMASEHDGKTVREHLFENEDGVNEQVLEYFESFEETYLEKNIELGPLTVFREYTLDIGIFDVGECDALTALINGEEREEIVYVCLKNEE